MSKGSANGLNEVLKPARTNEFQGCEVALVDWPSAAESRSVLRKARHPRLLLVPMDCDPPIMEDEFEDWVRTPADPRDVQARVARLRTRASRDVLPRLDQEGRIHFGGRWVALSPIECGLVARLLDHSGQVASKESLAEAGSSMSSSARNLDVQITRLRRRLENVGLTVRTVYAKGYVLERCSSSVSRASWHRR